MRVLIFHNIENLSRARNSYLNEFLAFERYAPEHDYLYHRIVLPVTETIRTTSWDAIIFSSTALGICTFRPRELFFEQKNKWSFLTALPAVKAVFPQDDPNCGGLMDDWFEEMNCDLMFNVLPDFVDLIYPRSSVRCKVIPTMCGFVDDLSLSSLRKYAKPFSERTCDIGQRVTMYPPRGGRHSRLKGETALAVREFALSRKLNVDISVDEKDIFFGNNWYRFLGNCRFVLGAESGMSIFDPYGEISDRITDYVSGHPNASIEEIERVCFPGRDGIHIFSTFSPRTFEAAMMGCCQILVEGDHGGILRPYEHYIPLKKDCSNMEEVFALMRDDVEVERRIARTYELLVDNPEYRCSTMVQRVLKYIEEVASSRNESCCRHDFRRSYHQSDFDDLMLQHRSDLEDIVIREAESIGFVGERLVERVLYTLGDQFAEPLVFRNRQSASSLYLYRGHLEQRVRSHVLTTQFDDLRKLIMEKIES